MGYLSAMFPPPLPTTTTITPFIYYSLFSRWTTSRHGEGWCGNLQSEYVSPSIGQVKPFIAILVLMVVVYVRLRVSDGEWLMNKKGSATFH